MVGTKQSLKDAGGGVHDAVISMLQEAMIKKGSLEMHKARIQMLQRLLSNRIEGKYPQIPSCL